MPDTNGHSDQFKEIWEVLAEINQTLARVAAIQKQQGEKMKDFDERQERTQRHLEVLIQMMDDMIRDTRVKDLQKRVSDLEEGGSD